MRYDEINNYCCWCYSIHKTKTPIVILGWRGSNHDTVPSIPRLVIHKSVCEPKFGVTWDDGIGKISYMCMCAQNKIIKHTTSGRIVSTLTLLMPLQT